MAFTTSWRSPLMIHDSTPRALSARIAAALSGRTVSARLNTPADSPLMEMKSGVRPAAASAVAQAMSSGLVVAVNASVPANNLNDFITYAKGKPGGVNYGSAGGGTSSQLSGELFNQMTGAKLTHIPYKGAGFALQALIAGEVQAAFLSTTTASAQVKSGRIKALAVLSPKRFSAAPDVPSAPESGLAGIESNVWFGLFAPAGTPKAIVAKINHDVTVALTTPEAREALLLQGAEASPMSPDQFAVFLKKEIDKWGKVIKEAGIRAE